MTVNAHARRLTERITTPLGRGLARLGVSGNGLTVFGLLAFAASAWLIVVERPLAAAAALVVGGLADVLDGPVARARGASSLYGAFLDSVADRIGDGVLLLALAWHVRDEPLLFGLAATAVVSAQVTSYVRAKAESIGVDCNVGLLERLERGVLVLAALIWPALLTPVLWVLAVGGTLTVAQRFVHVRRRLRTG